MKNESFKIRINWNAYFEEFKRVHGMHPILFKGRLLFEDGWQYSSTDKAGPEYAPPDNPVKLNTLLQEYWTRRLSMVEKELKEIRNKKRILEDLQDNKSVTLQHTVIRRDDDDIVRRENVALTSEIFEGRLAWLETDVRICKRKLNEVRKALKDTSKGFKQPNNGRK